MAGHCQDCTGCCVVFDVKEVETVAGQPCKHIAHTANGAGCAIYEERPDACRRYVCLWLDSQRRSDVEKFPESMRPDVTKCVLGWPWGIDRETLHVYTFPGYDDAWRKPPVNQYLRRLLLRGGKIVVRLAEGKMISIKGDTAFVGTEEEFAQLLQ